MSAPSLPIRLGVVGCARILPAHLRGIASLQAAGIDVVQITALCSRRREDALRFSSRGKGPDPYPPASTNPHDSLAAPHRYVSDLHPGTIPEIFEDWRAMLERDIVDAVVVLTPLALHHQVALDALQAGCHVLVEKPLAITVRTAQAIVEEARRRNLVAAVAENQRFTVRTRALRWVLGQGLIGDPQLWISAAVGGEWAPDRVVAHTPWRHRKLEGGGGPAIDHGVHLLHQLRYLLGPIEEIQAVATRLEPTRHDGGDRGREPLEVGNEVEDVYLAHLRFAGGAVGSVTSGWAGRGPQAGFHVPPALYGSLGAIHGDQVYGPTGGLGRAEDLLDSQLSPEATEAWFPGGVRDPFGLELLAFARAVAGGSPLEISAAEGALDLAAAYAVLESAYARQPVSVEAVAQGSVAAYQEEIDARYCS